MQNLIQDSDETPPPFLAQPLLQKHDHFRLLDFQPCCGCGDPLPGCREGSKDPALGASLIDHQLELLAHDPDSWFKGIPMDPVHPGQNPPRGSRPMGVFDLGTDLATPLELFAYRLSCGPSVSFRGATLRN